MPIESDGLRWLQAFATLESSTEGAAAWAGRTTVEIMTALPEITRDAEIAEHIPPAVHAHWVAFLEVLCEPTFEFRLPEEAEGVAMMVARSQLPLETLIRFYRVGQQATWSHITRVVSDIDSHRLDRAEILVYFWGRASQWIDQSITASVEVFNREHSRVRDSADARRFETVAAMLSGASKDERKASAELGGYPISAHHTAVIVTCESHDELELMDTVTRALAKSLGVTQPLLVRPGGRRLWCWMPTRDVPDLTPLRQEFDAVEHGTLRVALGSTQGGPSGFVASHHHALLVLDAMPVTPTGSIESYGDVELLVLLGCSADVDDFVRRTLGPLILDDEDCTRLRQTVSAFLESGGSVDAASRLLMIHRNTVRYRLTQVEKALGKPIARVWPELTVALRHFAAFHASRMEPIRQS